MPHDTVPEASPRTDIARADLRQAIMTAFCTVLHGTQLPPMSVLALAAQALGSIYTEVADAHCCDNACPCGWRPRPETDVKALQAALATATPQAPAIDLRVMQVAGRS